ncbi:MAG: hypothetical protein HC866_13170 [Leptolyngbyaceae cyanobacterium RU_5_1]|nr:hypothetical protein [Leptolyngbyaceae cyanobacterium RU_5_1]
MAIAYFEIPVMVQPTTGGDAELVLVQELHGLAYQFVQVNDGGREAIIQLNAGEAGLQTLSQTSHFTPLTDTEMAALKASYAPPKLKQRYRRAQTDAQIEESSLPFELDLHGNPVIEWVQTVRSGFYLVDVPVVNET